MRQRHIPVFELPGMEHLAGERAETMLPLLGTDWQAKAYNVADVVAHCDTHKGEVSRAQSKTVPLVQDTECSVVVRYTQVEGVAGVKETSGCDMSHRAVGVTVPCCGTVLVHMGIGL